MGNILWFRDIKKEDIPSVGGKGSNLGEMYNADIPIPSGFCVTVEAYKEFLEEQRKINERGIKVSILP